MVRSIAFVVLAVVPLSAMAEDPKIKAGDVVFPKGESVRMIVEEDGQKVAAEPDQIHYAVVAAKDGQVTVRTGAGILAQFDVVDVVPLQDAVAHFTEAIKAEASSDLYIRRAYAYKLQDQFDKAIGDFTEAIKLDPEDPTVHSHRGDAYSEAKEFDKAIADFTEAVKVEADYSDGYIARGNAYTEKKEYAKALKDYDRALEIDPKDALALISRGNLYLDRKEYEKAVSEYGEAIELAPESAYAYICRGNARAGQKDFAKALRDYDKAIQLEPESSAGYSARGNALADAREYGKALKDLDKAIELDPKSDYAINGKAWLLATCADPKFLDGKAAVTLATRACELTKWKDYNLLDTLAAASAESGKFEDAVKWQQKALENPNWSKEEKDDAKERLDLYKAKKPYRDEKK